VRFGVSVGVAVAVSVRVGLGVFVAVAVAVAVGVVVGVSVAVGVCVEVEVGVDEGVVVAVAVAEAVSVGVVVGVLVKVAVGGCAMGTTARLPKVFTTTGDVVSHPVLPSDSMTWYHAPSSLMPITSSRSSAETVVSTPKVDPGPIRTAMSRSRCATGVAGVDVFDGVAVTVALAVAVADGV
jgi:hypothetical protein